NIVSGTHPPAALQFHEVGRIRGPETPGSNDGNKADQDDQLWLHARSSSGENLKRKLQSTLDRAWMMCCPAIRSALACIAKAPRAAFPVRTRRRDHRSRISIVSSAVWSVLLNTGRRD